MATKTSKYYSLPPVGIGTPWVESLNGYLSRLAEAHCVPTAVLVNQEVSWRVFRGSTTKLSYPRSLIAVEMIAWGFSESPYVRAAEEITQILDLHRLTLQGLVNVFRPHLIIRRTKAWCPECYASWRCSGVTIYEPLIWEISALQVCPVHGCLLADACPTCGGSFHSLSPYIRPGYCARCGSWLGRNKAIQRGVTDREICHAQEILAIMKVLQEDGLLAESKARRDFLSDFVSAHYGYDCDPREIFHPYVFPWREELGRHIRNDRLQAKLEVCRIHGLSLSQLLRGRVQTQGFRPWSLWTERERQDFYYYRQEVEMLPASKPVRVYRPERGVAT